MIMTAERNGIPGFGETEIPTVPLPEPELPDVIVIQETLLAALQLQPVGAGTLTLTVLPAAPSPAPCGERVMPLVHVETPSCPIVISRPATVILPTRAAPLFVAIEILTVPFPEPPPPDVIVSQLALLVAVQLQLAGAPTYTDPAKPAAGKFIPPP